jgi:ATP-dependent RNA circularization protein (DNA/RNA ligase family)
MTSEFFRFPHTHHLAWLGVDAPRDDKVLSAHQAGELLAREVMVEEKIDGANLGLSLAPDGRLQVQNRGQYLVEPFAGQFARLPGWLEQHGNMLRTQLTPGIVLFGEWCAARHAIKYTRLPDWFLLFDVYDRRSDRFWSVSRRNALASRLGLSCVPLLLRGQTTLADLKDLIAQAPSAFGEGPLEGVLIRQDSADWCEARAKLVRSDFIQAIDDHWRRRAIEWNRVDISVAHQDRLSQTL